MKSQRRRVALAIVAFAAPLAVTLAVDAHPVDDGTTYRWVNPPHSRLTDNVPPAGRVASLPPGSPVQAFWTPDLQLTLAWTTGGVGENGVTFDVQPIDPASLRELPKGFSANGNAYRVEFSPVDRLGGGTVHLVVPSAPSGVFHSPDGRAWRKLAPANGDDGLASAAVDRGGFVVAASTHNDEPAGFPVVAIAGMFAAAGVAIEVLRRVRRRRRKASSEQPAPLGSTR